ncbi:PARP-domain-containing protein [Teratosphaeria nubilosa]|uniref:Poly [ADP-ribose] polymerase n=1 Tax=Teratosphaeria nubilosa TaxID=161662 RepID=A0A6G1LEG2_9PEZI|nr:PARP-domain-containing protein [Teratosphaeria nubilosa]
MADYSKQKVPELKALLKALLKERGLPATGLPATGLPATGLPATGLKKQLIDALQQDDADNGVRGGFDLMSDEVNKDADDEDDKKSRGARKAEGLNADDNVPVLVPTKSKPSAASKAQFAPGDIKLQIPVDEHCHLSHYRVYVGEDGIIYDALLNQSNTSNNNYKFYRIQLLEGPHGEYRTWTCWGRVGARGQTALLGDDITSALNHFEKKFKDKSGLTWANRLSRPLSGKYAFIEKSYHPESDDEDDEPQAAGGASNVREHSYSPPKCTLEAPVKSLMELIFNEQYMSEVMADMNYDQDKMPLGKLSKTSIQRGFEALKELSELLDSGNYSQVEDVSNLYYSLIPHAFGRNRPPVINNQAMLKREVDLLESLSDLKVADEIMKGAKGDKSIHPLDARYQGLGMREMTPVPTTTKEFSEIEQYSLRTQMHGGGATVQDIFRIDRFDSFSSSGSDRRLLWHGSRATKFGGILGQGLRIAPPEAPVNGYMFAKGIYLADMSSKSANYCCSYNSGGHALLLLCEAELGNPILVLRDAKYDADLEVKKQGLLLTMGQGRISPVGWKDAGCITPGLAGVMMPDTAQPPVDTGVSGYGSHGYAPLMYNEYICYNVAQVRLRYLLRVRM